MEETLEQHLEKVREECARLGFDEEETLRMIHIHEGIDKGVRDGDKRSASELG